MTRLLFAVRRVVAAKGVWGVVNMAWRKLLRLPIMSEPRLVEYPFDARHGLLTAGLVKTTEEEDQFAYYGVNPSVFREACRRWVATLDSAADVEQYSFVDLGSGLGRALLMASELPFRQVVGVEVSADLVADAQTNVEKWVAAGNARVPIRIQHGDARGFQFPPAPVLLFLYNPFGEATLLQILTRLRAAYEAKAGPVDILYCHPKFGYVFGKSSNFKELWLASIPLDEEDRAADAFYSKVEVCALYRLTSPRKNGGAQSS